MQSTIKVFIHFTNEPTLEFDFLQDKLTWTNLLTLIECTRRLGSPGILYYKRDDTIETLSTQSQLESLLLPTIMTDEMKGLCLYAQAGLVRDPVHVLPRHAYLRLSRFMEQHKETIASHPRLSKWVDVLDSSIAKDTQGLQFDHEFKVLEALAADTNGETVEVFPEQPKKALFTFSINTSALFRQEPFGGREFANGGNSAEKHRPLREQGVQNGGLQDLVVKIALLVVMVLLLKSLVENLMLLVFVVARGTLTAVESYAMGMDMLKRQLVNSWHHMKSIIY
ncbi:hypothetical protein INT47_011466 [Mucor saturninus]|uniref:Uncharacterized protein n=1 Tax=Mucor saturninus TaxID=64648 RepID=A0A8H7QXG1_9FUNG|nr:hypothetical protein INT47_011466 [Mucor saturninus]